MKQALSDRGLLSRIALSPTVDALLTALQPDTPVPPGPDVRGTVQLGVDQHLGFLALDLKPPGPPIPYHLVSDASSFRLWLLLSQTPPAKKIFSFATGAAGAVLMPASKQTDGRLEWLEPAGGDVSLTGVEVTLLVEGQAGGTASLGLSPTDGQPDGIVRLGLDPPTVLLGGSGFGLELPQAVWLDDSDTAAPEGQTVVDGRTLHTAADQPPWKGLAVRQARFFLPRGVPFFGGHSVEAYVEVGSSPSGIDLAVATRWSPPPGGDGWGFDVLIECRDPAATGLQDFIPTLVEAAMTLPLEEAAPQVDGQGFSVLAGKPVVARLRFARSSADPETKITLALESQGPNGVLTVQAPEGGPAARAFISAGALSTAMVADKPPPDADASGVGLHAVLMLALGFSSFLKDKGRLTLNAVELESTGHGLPVGSAVKLRLDYSVDVIVKPISVGALSVEMADEQPMRVRNRNVGLTIDFAKPGLDKIRLDFSAADMEIEDPGLWRVQGPASLFDILGTRSGRGSTWLEVDLRFKLNLGPVKVSGATIRATAEDDGSFSASLRGLDVSVSVPGAIDGSGKLQLLQGGGFEAELDASLVPLNLAAGAVVLYQPHGESFWLFLKIGVDLPGPIPVANTGLGIYGIAGAFGVNARPVSPPPTDPDPIGFQLKWDSSDPLTAFNYSQDNLTIGAEAVVGTVPDLGFSFSAKGGLYLTIPDLAIRGALYGKVLSPRLKVTDHPSDADLGLSFKGVVVVDSHDGVTIGLKGELNAKPLIDVLIPLGAHFPFSGSGVDPSDWFIYLGADGYANPSRPDGRGLGPIRATVLPDLMPVEADAYLMQRGKGIDKWPRGGPITIPDGFVLCFGFGFEYTIGVVDVVWADVHASLDVLIATRPLLLAGFGTAGGSLNLGPLSIGVDAQLSFLVAEHADPYIHARLCGHIDLLFTEIEGCVQISINNEPAADVPLPDVHPLDDIQNGVAAGDLAFLIDDRYRRIGALSRSHDNLAPVWPDTLVHLSFAVSPKLAGGYTGGQFAGIDAYPSGLAAEPVGSKMLRYEWTLIGLRLFDVTDDPGGAGTEVAGPLSAAWQLGKDGDMGVRPQAGDLVLLTYQGDLWLNRLADGGADLPYDPVKETAGLCQGDVAAQLGWAVGFGASTAEARFVLPSDPLSTDPTASTFTATVTLGWEGMPGVVFGPLAARSLPSPYQYDPPEIEASAPPLELEREFDGVLDLGGVSGPTRQSGEGGVSSALLEPSDELDDARLWLLADRVGERVLVVEDNRGQSWHYEEKPLASGRVAVRFTPPASGTIKSVTVSWMLGNRVGILGLGGMTAAAERAAQARQDARAAEAARQAAAAAAQPQGATTKTGAETHCVLDPGRTYRLDVEMSWSGWLEQQQEDGSTKESSKLDQTAYAPKGGGDPSTNRSFFFRTTPKPDPRLKPAQLVYGQDGYLALLHRRQDVFDPQMLQRHVAGFTPAQSEHDRFRNDPLQVHFSASHVATLAKEYGFDLKLGLRRVDAPGDDGKEQVLNPVLIAMQEPSFLGTLDRRRFDVAEASLCPVPKPGATLQATEPLAPQAWYEVFVLAQGSGDIADGRLPGVTFETSRWLGPADMLGDLGFTSPAGKATGELALDSVPGLPVQLGQDAGFEAALDALGLDGWPPAGEPRLSLLWLRPQQGQPWSCAGLLVESVEPIHRPGRCEVQGLTLAPAQDGISFQLARSDRNSSRLLFLASQPFEPAAGSELVLTLVDKAGGAPPSGAIVLPAQPALEDEP